MARSVEEISVYDVYCALEGKECEIKLSGIGDRIFIDGKKFNQGEEKVMRAFELANIAFGNELRKVMLSDLISREHYLKGDVDFLVRNAVWSKRNHE